MYKCISFKIELDVHAVHSVYSGNQECPTSVDIAFINTSYNRLKDLVFLVELEFECLCSLATIGLSNDIRCHTFL